MGACPHNPLAAGEMYSPCAALRAPRLDVAFEQRQLAGRRQGLLLAHASWGIASHHLYYSENFIDLIWMFPL